MRVGTAVVDITPSGPVEMAGYLARVQPSVGVHDPIRVRALYLEEGRERLLILHADLLGLPADFVRICREGLRTRCGLQPRQIVLSTSHTHSGPSTLALINCGKFESDYIASLHARFEEAALRAAGRTEDVAVEFAEGRSELAQHRRGPKARHVDPRVGVVAFRRADGTYAAVLANYAMHNVGLSHDNRLLSGDIGAHAAMALEQQLPGGPCVLFTAGAAGNINPPTLSTDFAQIAKYGAELAGAVTGALPKKPSKSKGMAAPVLATAHHTIALPLDPVTEADIDRIAGNTANVFGADTGYLAARFRDAVNTWRSDKKFLLRQGGLPRTETIELQAIRIADHFLLTVNAEIFSRLGDDLRGATGRPGYVLGYSNGCIGYVPTEAAYDEPGYEVDSAFIFFNSVRVRRGGFELVRDRAAEMVRKLFESDGGRGASC